MMNPGFGPYLPGCMPWDPYGEHSDPYSSMTPANQFHQPFGSTGMASHTSFEQMSYYSTGPCGVPFQQNIGPPGMPTHCLGEQSGIYSQGAAGGSFQQALVPRGHGNTRIESREVYTDGSGARYERQMRFNASSSPAGQMCFNASSARAGYIERPRLMAPQYGGYYPEPSFEKSSSSSSESSSSSSESSSSSSESSSSAEESSNNNDSSEDSSSGSEHSDTDSEESESDSESQKSNRKSRFWRATVASINRGFNALKVFGRSHKKKKRSH